MLDECDEMLNMGFVEDVEKILNAGGDIKVQTLLFSATLPSWVKDITRRFLQPTHKLVDLVGTDKMKVRIFLTWLWTEYSADSATSDSILHSLPLLFCEPAAYIMPEMASWRCLSFLVCVPQLYQGLYTPRC